MNYRRHLHHRTKHPWAKSLEEFSDQVFSLALLSVSILSSEIIGSKNWLTESASGEVKGRKNRQRSVKIGTPIVTFLTYPSICQVRQVQIQLLQSTAPALARREVEPHHPLRIMTLITLVMYANGLSHTHSMKEPTIFLKNQSTSVRLVIKLIRTINRITIKKPVNHTHHRAARKLFLAKGHLYN